MAATKKTAKTKTEEESEENGVVVTVNFSDREKTYTIALADLTVREQIETEEFFDTPFIESVASGWLLGSRKGLVWLAYLARRREEPTFSYDTALDTFETIVDDQTERPTEASKDAGNPS